MFDREHIRSVADITRAQAKAAPGNVAHVFEGRATTYGQLNELSNRVAQAFIAEGCKPGARVGFIGKNSDRYFEMLHGAFKAKAVVVGVNWRLAPPEVAYVLNDAKVEVLFVGAEFYDTVAQVLSECPSVRRVVALDLRVRSGRRCHPLGADRLPGARRHRLGVLGSVPVHSARARVERVCIGYLSVASLAARPQPLVLADRPSIDGRVGVPGRRPLRASPGFFFRIDPWQKACQYRRLIPKR